MFTQIKKRSEGFTIVELLIVIVVIGILAALVLNTFQGVQARARDTERKTDINAMHTQLEVFYNDNGYYLSVGTAITPANLPGLDGQAILDPDKNAIGSGDYTFTAAGCTGLECTSYTLSADLEEADDYTKTSLNN